MSAALVAENLSIGYRGTRRGDVSVASAMNASLRAGELTCLLGPNGAGKSTLLRTLCGMQAPLAGNVQIAGQALSTLGAPELARLLSVVLTERVETEYLSVWELVALGRFPFTGWLGRLSDEDRAAVQRAIRQCELESFATRMLPELSDGERQRALIARALAQETPLVLLDEPTAFLDVPRRVEVLRLLWTLARETGKAFLVSTHDLDLALRCADRLWVLAPGTPLVTGLPEELALSGVLERTFRGQGFAFNSADGTFHIERTARGQIKLSGSGPAAHWTRRALERHGYTLQENAAVCVSVSNGPKWSIEAGGPAREAASLPDALALIEELSAAKV